MSRDYRSSRPELQGPRPRGVGSSFKGLENSSAMESLQEHGPDVLPDTLGPVAQGYGNGAGNGGNRPPPRPPQAPPRPPPSNPPRASMPAPENFMA